jgi:2-haloacid dehalogenase
MSQTIYVFDAYGTLFDLDSPVERMRTQIGAESDRISQIWREKVLEYTWVHGLAGKHIAFRKLLRQSLDFAMTVCHVPSADLRDALLAGYDDLSAFPEVKETLRSLRRQNCRIAILSNGDPDMLDKVVRSNGLQDLFDALLSVAEVGVFKPSSRVYRLALTRFGATREQITFVSSNRWDVAGAQAFGLKPVWVNRSGRPDEYPDMPPAAVIQDLTKLPAMMKAGQSSKE